MGVPLGLDIARTSIRRCCRPRSCMAANSAYIEALQAQYEKDPLSVDAGWRDFFAALGDDPVERREDRGRAPSWQQPNWPQAPQGRPHQRARRRLAGDGEGASARSCAPRRRKPQPAAPVERGRDPPRDPRFRARADDDPRLSHARPSARQSRSARPRAAEGSRGAASGDLRLPRGRLRPQDLHRPCARARIRDRARDAGDPAPHLLRHDRLRVHPHFRSRRESLDPGAHRGPATRRSASPGRASAPSSQAGRGRRLREASSTSNIPAPSASASTAPRR